MHLIRTLPIFLNNVMVIADTFNNSDKIIFGDFNLVQDPILDYSNYKYINNKKAREKALEIKATYYLTDTYREYYPSARRYTWRKGLQQSRLYFFLISEILLSSINTCNIESSYRSDHSTVILKCNFNHEDIQFTINDQLFLDTSTLLMEIRGKTISYSSFKKKESDKREREIIQEIEKIEQSLNANNIIERRTVNIAEKENGGSFHKITCSVY